jgi:hypothetical protein
MAKRKPKERGSIQGAFAWRLIEMLESPANRVMSLSAKRVLERLEIELFRHGGKPQENGLLACTFEHFVEFGIDRHAIAPAIREAVALGFVQITRPGCAGNANYRQPTLYRLTYRHSGSHRETTDEWRRIATIEEAKAIAERARSQHPEHPRPKIRKPVGENPLTPVGGTHTGHDQSPVGETPTTVPVGETPTTSISRMTVSVRRAEGTTLEDTDIAPTANSSPGAPPSQTRPRSTRQRRASDRP